MITKRYIYVPDKVVANPPLVVVIHSCQSTAQSYFRNSKIPWAQGSDKKGYITVWPSSPHSGTCWDVSSRQSLKHDGGGDAQAISNMILYAVAQYKVDRGRVFVTGGSSGGKLLFLSTFLLVWMDGCGRCYVKGTWYQRKRG